MVYGKLLASSFGIALSMGAGVKGMIVSSRSLLLHRRILNEAGVNFDFGGLLNPATPLLQTDKHPFQTGTEL